MDEKEIRLRILEVLAPIASRVEIKGEALIEKAKEMERYVKGTYRKKK